MGIDISSKLIVGATYDEVYAAYKNDPYIPDTEDYTFEDWLEEVSLTQVIPWYDCDEKYCYYGIDVGDGDVESVIKNIYTAKKEFELICPGVVCQVIQSPHVY